MPLRVVQLTDLHLGSRLDDLRWRQLMQRVAGLVQRVGQVDRLVLTGDLAKRGQPAIYAALHERLAPWADKLRVLPGNHDDASMVRAAFTGRMTQDAPATGFVEDLNGVRLVGLNTAVRGHIGGAVGDAQLEWLSRTLLDAPASVLFMHHPPIAVGAWWLDKDRLRDQRALAEVIAERRVLGVFCGHVHQAAEGALGAVPVWTTPSTAYQFKPHALIPRTERVAPGFRVIEVTDGTLRTRVERW